MKLLIQSAMIFFGTLMAAALLALGDPRGSEAGGHAINQLLQSALAWMEEATPDLVRPLMGWHE